ncbi:hypothetical protein TIFTF001_001630 [Ficus carica]|uniref:Uncharacterized protein n=1 Tax=Ficus carica TaxID=3494 RepID=A0AA88D542_FICCA|nr:hypothetical protein TIFTF001_001630 [Ficus carica]
MLRTSLLVPMINLPRWCMAVVRMHQLLPQLIIVPESSKLSSLTSFSSGGEDGYMGLHHFDRDYFNIKI